MYFWKNNPCIELCLDSALTKGFLYRPYLKVGHNHQNCKIHQHFDESIVISWSSDLSHQSSTGWGHVTLAAKEKQASRQPVLFLPPPPPLPASISSYASTQGFTQQQMVLLAMPDVTKLHKLNSLDNMKLLCSSTQKRNKLFFICFKYVTNKQQNSKNYNF